MLFFELNILMQKKDFVNKDSMDLLGKTSEDTQVVAFLRELKQQKTPCIQQGETTVVLENRELGIEVTFRDEASLDVHVDKYKKGDLVLSNIRWYGDTPLKFSKFDGRLPLQIFFSFNFQQVIQKMKKKPDWGNKSMHKYRWDFDTYCVFVTFEKGDVGIRHMAVQLPLAP